ncbi:UDP-2,4-diacetamido-2,4,6-trideoxy-beta-L-altropyranose hydrolase [Caminibacter sp.]
MVIIRTDFSSDIGFGHLRRQEAFIKWKIENEKWKIDDFVIICKECEQKYTNIPIIKVKNEEEFFEKVKELKPDEVVIDSYTFGIENEKKFKKFFPDIKLICFDDTYEEHFCDLIINPNIYADTSKYKIPAKKLLIVRSEFYNVKKIDKEKTILIAMGGVDNKKLSFKVYKAIKDFGFNIEIVTTSANKNLKELKKLDAKIIINTKDMANLIYNSSLIICTPSVTLNEVFFLKKPFIAIKSADNQKEMVNFLKKNNYPVLEEWNKEKFLKFFKEKI